MKNILYFLILSVLVFNSCKKEDSNPVKEGTTNRPPAEPSSPSPITNTTGQPTSLTLSWTCSDPDGDALTYDVYFGTSNNPTTRISSAQSGNSINRSYLTESTTYYWKIIAKDNKGASTSGSIWNFTTAVGSTSPTVTTTSISGVTTTTASGGGNVTSQGSASVTARGVCWSTNQNPTIANSKTTDGTGTGSFTSSITGLTASTTYYVRAYATNSAGTSYGNQVSFTTSSSGASGTPCPGTATVTYDGKTYNTVLIGNQCWLKENLNVGVYVPSVNTGSSHSDLSNNGIIEKYCYGNDTLNCNTYGGLYDWNEAMQYVTTPGTKGICPTGWHIPTRAEFETLMAAVNDDGNALKALGQGTGSGAGTNTSGFSALLAGYRYYYGYFYDFGSNAYFWSSTEYNSYDADNMSLWLTASHIVMGSSSKTFGNSVRCVKD